MSWLTDKGSPTGKNGCVKTLKNLHADRRFKRGWSANVTLPLFIKAFTVFVLVMLTNSFLHTCNDVLMLAPTFQVVKGS